VELGVLSPDGWRVLIMVAAAGFLVTTLGWIAGLATAKPAATPADELARLRRSARRHTWTFLNALLIAPFLVATLALLLAGPDRPPAGVLDAVGLTFAAGYLVISTTVYTSQLALPRALDRLTDRTAELWLFSSPTSVPYGLDMLGYAVFGLAAAALSPGLLMASGVWTWAGVALLASGVLSVLGFAGYLARRRALEWFTTVGGGFAVPFALLVLVGAATGQG
jgi:hypothetical protein